MRNLNKPEISMAGKSRKIDRNIARARMRKMGVAKPNKEKLGIKGNMVVTLPSYFATHWRAFAR